MKSKRQTAESKVKEIRRHTRKKYSAEEKIRIVIEGLRGETTIAELCRREGINANLYYKWSKDFLEACKSRLDGDIRREATVCRQPKWNLFLHKVKKQFYHYLTSFMAKNGPII